MTPRFGIKSDSSRNIKNATITHLRWWLIDRCKQQKGLKVYQWSKGIFQRASLNIRKRSSNNLDINAPFRRTDRYPRILDKSTNSIKVLELSQSWWDYTFLCSASDSLEQWQATINTKSAVLQATGKLYDPTGFLAPFVIRTKLLFQGIWRKKLDWDEKSHKEMQTTWDLGCRDLALLRKDRGTKIL